MAKKTLRQRSTNDCGIAALAMLLDVTYADMRRVTLHYFQNILGKKFSGTDDQNDRELAEMFDEELKVYLCNTPLRRARALTALGDKRAIICVPYFDSNATLWHAVFWDGKRLHDPGARTATGKNRYGKDGARAFKLCRTIAILSEECEDC